jgi:hypothetical protein
MHCACRTIPGIALIVWCAASALVAVHGEAQTVETVRSLVVVCPELPQPSGAVPDLAVSLSITVPAIPAVVPGVRTRSEEKTWVELQVPEALVRTLMLEERSAERRTPLWVPPTLPMRLATEDWEQIP